MTCEWRCRIDLYPWLNASHTELLDRIETKNENCYNDCILYLEYQRLAYDFCDIYQFGCFNNSQISTGLS